MHRIWLAIFLLLPLRAMAEKVLITADPQYGWFGDKSCPRERRDFRRIVEIVNREGFDALIILGDLADSYPRSRTRRARQVGFFLEDLKLVKRAQVFLVAGNHDLGDDASPWAIREFRRAFGFPDRYAFRVGGYKFIVLNTTLIQNYRRYPREYSRQLDFIRRNADAEFVLGHHPPFNRSPREGDGYYRWKAKPRGQILPLLAPGTFFFSGHTHRPFQTVTERFRNLGVGTCCAPWPRAPQSYGVLEISPQTVRFSIRFLR